MKTFDWSLSLSLSVFLFFVAALCITLQKTEQSFLFSLSFSSKLSATTMCSVQMSQDELRKAIVGIQMDSTIDEAEKAARRQALLTGKWKPGDGESFSLMHRCF